MAKFTSVCNVLENSTKSPQRQNVMWVKNVDHQLRHEADSDELRAVAEESAEGLREHFYWQKSRKPEAGQR
ncbi:TPA: DUF2554 family protein [Escherichia coli]